MCFTEKKTEGDLGQEIVQGFTETIHPRCKQLFDHQEGQYSVHPCPHPTLSVDTEDWTEIKWAEEDWRDWKIGVEVEGWDYINIFLCLSLPPQLYRFLSSLPPPQPFHSFASVRDSEMPKVMRIQTLQRLLSHSSCSACHDDSPGVKQGAINKAEVLFI